MPRQSGNPFLLRVSQTPDNAHGRKSERRVASLTGARLQPNSGAMQGHKSDATRAAYRMEMKSTIHQTLPVQREWLRKITKEALHSNMTPVVTLSFVGSDGKPQDLNADWVMMPAWKFKELLELEENRG